MKHKLRMLLILLVGLSAVGITSAQSDLPEMPLVILANNSLYAWTPEQADPTMLTMNSFTLPPVVSPYSTEIAYTTFAPLTIDAIQRTGGIGGGALPSDIWVMNPTTRQLREIAGQPENASFFTEGVDDYAISRSVPAWSWDGMKLAFAEHIYPSHENQLALYDFATNSARIVYRDFPEQAAVAGPMVVKWVGAFMVVHSISTDIDYSDRQAFYVFSADGALIRTINLPTGYPMLRYEAVQQGDRYFIGVQSNDGEWILFEPLHGTQAQVNGYVEMYAWPAPETSLALEPRYDESGTPIWQAYDAAGQIVDRFSTARYFPAERITLSPDGQTVAYSEHNAETRVFENVVRVVRGTAGANVPDVSDNPFVSSVAWGPMAWRTRVGATAAPPNAPILSDYAPLP